jgi:hypothetical protein
MKRTFEIGLGCISSPLTLIRNRKEYREWQRKITLSETVTRRFTPAWLSRNLMPTSANIRDSLM